MLNREVRAGQPAKIDNDGDEITVAGHAAVFNQRAAIADYFVEVIHPGAFEQAIRSGEDVPFLIEHDGLPLARTSSGTLQLAEDATGLKMTSTLDGDDPDVMRIVPKMKRGDLSKMSFAFRAVREEWDYSGALPVRNLYQVDLYDVSIVTVPAYDGTDIALRSLEAGRGASPLIRPASLIAVRARIDLDLRVRRHRA